MTVIAAILALVGFIVFLTGALLAIGHKNRVQLANLIGNWTGSALEAVGPLFAQWETVLADVITPISSAFQNHGGALADPLRAPIADFVKGELDVVTAGLVANGESTPDNAVGIAADAMADAFGFGLSSAAVTAAFEALFPEKLNVLNGAGPMIAKFAGFDEVAAAVRDPLYEHAFGRSLDYHFRALFKPELPNEADAVTWHSRRLLTDAQLQTIFNYSGLKQEYEAPFIASAYRAVQPRALATLFQDTDVPVAAMRSALQFAGIRDQEIDLMLPAFVWNAVKNVRNEYITALVRSAELGTATMAELAQELNTLGYSAAASDLIQLTVATRKELQLAELYRKSISEAYRYGQITDAQYVPSLEAIGISAADAQAHYAVDSIAKTGKAAAAALRAEERLASQRMRAAVAAAIASYKSGLFDAAALEGALLAAGMDPVVAGLSVEVQTQRRAGNVVLVYGVELPRAAALELREKVAALGIQVRARLVSPDDALTALVGYGVPRANALALVAEWAATTVAPARVGVLEPR